MKIDKSKELYDQAALKVLAQVRQCELLFFGQGMRVACTVMLEDGTPITWAPAYKRFQVGDTVVSGDPMTPRVDHHKMDPYIVFLENFPAVYVEAARVRDEMTKRLSSVASLHAEWVTGLGPMRVIEPE